MQTEFGVFEIAHGIFTRPREIAIGCDTIAGFGGSVRVHHLAVVTFFRQRAVKPEATGIGFVDEDRVGGLRWHLTDELINLTLAGANGSQEHDLGTVILSHRGNSDGGFVGVRADPECARLRLG